MRQMPSSPCPCDDCAHYLRCKHQLLACNAFATWVSVGTAHPGIARSPNREGFADLALYESGHDRHQAARQHQARELLAAQLAELQRKARRQSLEYRRLVAAGLAEPLGKAQLREIRLVKRWQRWKIAPSLRERHLQLKREDAIRRGRRNGSAAAGSEGNRLHRIEAQHRRREAERHRDGRTMSGLQFRMLRLQLGLTVWDVAVESGVSYHTAKQWQRSAFGPPGRVVHWLAAVTAGHIDPIRGRQPTARGARLVATAKRNKGASVLL
jgi:hypothetical protein